MSTGFSSNDDLVSIEREGTNGIRDNVSAAASAVKNSLTNGPVAENVKQQSAKTQADISKLAATRTAQRTRAATGQPLTHYHSFFHSLLSWEHPRASGIAYLFTVFLIFAARYINVFRYSLKLTYMILGVTVFAEIVGKVLFNHGFTSQVRPKEYYTISQETLNLLIRDFHDLFNFFVIEAQQIIFAENLPVSIAAFFSAFVSYFLVKYIPLWGLSLLGTSTLFLGTLAYRINQDVIDRHLENAAEIITQQTEQVKTIASQQAARATKQTKALVGDYSSKAQGFIGNALPSVSPVSATAPIKRQPVIKKEAIATLKAEDFPRAPMEELKSHSSLEAEVSSLRHEINAIREENPLIST
ncbi:hypothetical protein K3495_g9869 [Podosphaera aphanis]|nr:hypothetical protein K3495_g9869 [Podosphaera aphanis]